MIQVVLIMLVTDLARYWLHLVDILVTRSLSLMPMVLLGFSSEAINVYLPILALQSVFIHCNLEFDLPWLQKLVTTPKFQHWHHTSDREHLDRNFSISLPVLDLVFGTYYSPPGKWPEAYGLAEDKLEERYLAHLLTPFSRKKNTGFSNS